MVCTRSNSSLPCSARRAATASLSSGRSPPVAQLVVGYATGYALTRRALPLGGTGIVETLLPFALGWVGIALAPALLAVFGY
jgi:hypothetical protein